jgi:hypothetical protein
MRSTKIALRLAALGLGTALLAVGAQAQDTYPIGRGANDGGFVQAKPGNSGQQNGPTTGGERQFSWEGNDAAYGGQYRGGGQYGGGLYNSAPSSGAQNQADQYKYSVGRSANDGGMVTTPQAEKGAERTGSASNKEAFRSGNETYNFGGQGQPPRKAPGRYHYND